MSHDGVSKFYQVVSCVNEIYYFIKLFSYLYYLGIKFFIYIYPFNPKGRAEVGVAVESRGRRTGDDLCKAG